MAEVSSDPASEQVGRLPDGRLAVRCPPCGAEQEITTDPINVMLEQIDAFTRLHAVCG